MNTIGERLEYFIKMNFNSITEFSSIMNYESKNIEDYCNGISEIPNKCISELSIIGLNTNWLFTGCGEMNIIFDIPCMAEIRNVYNEDYFAALEITVSRAKWKNDENSLLKHFNWSKPQLKEMLNKKTPIDIEPILANYRKCNYAYMNPNDERRRTIQQYGPDFINTNYSQIFIRALHEIVRKENRVSGYVVTKENRPKCFYNYTDKSKVELGVKL